MEQPGRLGFKSAAGLFILGLAASSCGLALGIKDVSLDPAGGGGTSGAGGSSTTTSDTGSTGGVGTDGSAFIRVIDDMEDMNEDISMVEGRVGTWYSYNDMTAAGVQTLPLDPNGTIPFPMSAIMLPRGTSQWAAHTAGMGFTTWGAGFGFDLNTILGAKSGYDASKYTGVHFYAKMGASASAAIRFLIGDVNTAPEGGICHPSGADANCSDHFGQDLTLTTDWQEFTIAFTAMTQEGWAMQTLPSIDKSKLYYIHFQARPTVNFDIWVDDIAFYE